MARATVKTSARRLGRINPLPGMEGDSAEDGVLPREFFEVSLESNGTVNRIIQEVADEAGVDPGFLVRILELEEGVAHLARRHGLFEELETLSRQAARRALQSHKGLSNEDQDA